MLNSYTKDGYNILGKDNDKKNSRALSNSQDQTLKNDFNIKKTANFIFTKFKRFPDRNNKI